MQLPRPLRAARAILRLKAADYRLSANFRREWRAGITEETSEYRALNDAVNWALADPDLPAAWQDPSSMATCPHCGHYTHHLNGAPWDEANALSDIFICPNCAAAYPTTDVLPADPAYVYPHPHHRPKETNPVTTTQTTPDIGNPRVLAPLNGPATLDGMSRTTITFDDGTTYTIAGWSVTTYAPDANGVIRAQLTGWLTEHPESTVTARVVSGHLAGHEPLDGKMTRRATWSVGAPFNGETGKSEWDHPGLWVTLRWIHAVVPAGTTFAELIDRHKNVVAMIIGEGEKTDLGELTPPAFIDHIGTVTALLGTSPAWDSEKDAAVAAYTCLGEALPLSDSDPAKATLLDRADGYLKELGDESDWLC